MMLKLTTEHTESTEAAKRGFVLPPMGTPP
jgi:hypothetical protein